MAGLGTTVRQGLVSAAPLAVGVAVAFGLGAVLPTAGTSYSVFVALWCGIAVVSAVSLNVVLGIAGQFSMGHAGFMAVGAYASALVTKAAGGEGGVSGQLSFLAATIVGGLVASAAGWAVGAPSLRLKGDYLAIVTLGFGEIIRSIIENTPSLGGATGLGDIPQYTTFGWIWAWVVVVVLFSQRLLSATHGRAMLAVREDEVAAEAMGVDTTGYKVRAFVLSAFFAGVAGALYAHQLTTVNPKSFTFIRSFEIITMVVLGGMGSTTGALAAAIGLTVLPEGLKTLQDVLVEQADIKGWSEDVKASLGRDYKNVIFSVLLVLTMLLRPKGLLGRFELWDLWRKPKPVRDADGKAGDAADLHESKENKADPVGSLLVADKATIRFGGLTAVKDFTLALAPRELVALIGPNGAGKTTVFNLLTGVYAPTDGHIRVLGTATKGLRPHRIAALGAARTFQNIRLFKELTAFDNVRIACHHRSRAGLFASLRRGALQLREEAWIAARAESLLEVMGLLHRRDERAASLPYGEQRRLEIARALATGPRVLLLDEPAAGMNATEKVELMNLIRSIRDRFGVAILLIEHDMKLVMGVSERIIVLDHGETIAEGTPKEIQANPKVIEAYLGVEGGAAPH